MKGGVVSGGRDRSPGGRPASRPSVLPIVAAPCGSVSKACQQQRGRARRLLSTELEFVAAAEFKTAGDGPPPWRDDIPWRGRSLREYLRGLDESYLLSHDEERALFREMNYAKFVASRLRSRLDPEQPCGATMDRIDRLCELACAIRNRIVFVSMKLAISIVRRIAGADQRFDELLSEGYMTLLRAVEKFDYSRGFRFSTYATHAVQRAVYQFFSRRQRRRVEQGIADLEALGEPDFRCDRSQERALARNLKTLDSLVEDLEPRDRYIVESRFGLGALKRPLTLQRVADQLGISRERVRQLETRAIGRLRSAAAEAGLEPPL